MHFLSLFASLQGSVQQHDLMEVLELNEKTRLYGLVLTPNEVQQLLVARTQVLSSYGRVELSIEITKDLIELFSASPFLEQEDYLDTLNDLHEVFYCLKNETEDKISDRMLLQMMKERYEEDCGGSMDLLKSRLEEYAEQFRRDLPSWEEGEEDEWKLNL
ncbi:DUF6323 family protein [Gorillibacterium sp. CAU 1737]|uniref:DUF6323 family protein n=1 Tax=Gorillibacterium sp. CAU 1737 TaxID=3140362 RepID=UPI003260AE52